MARQVVVAFLAVLTLVYGTPLDDYVRRPDDSFTWEKIGEIRDEENGLTIHQLNMTSQTWRNEEEVSRSVWFHYMAVVVPDEIAYTENSFIFISDGNNPDEPPAPGNDYFLGLVIDFVLQNNVVGVLINQIPNQPIRFASDPKEENRREDNAIAYTWREYIDAEGADPDVLLLLPMTKAAVRAMDTAEMFIMEELGLDIQHFFLTGGSKRGWTTYLAAAADPKEGRVIGIAPMVITILNTLQNLQHHQMALGGWSFAFRPYWRENITLHLTDPIAEEMAAIMDPYDYRERLTMPKYIIAASGDEFFQPHESRHFFSEMQEPKYFMMLPNAEHTMVGHHNRLIRNMGAFFSAIVHGYDFPEISWIIDEDEDDGVIIFESDVDPISIQRFRASTTFLTPDSRDFRLVIGDDPSVNPCVWYSSNVTNITETDGVYRFMTVEETPEDGYSGFFIVAEFEMPDGKIFETTSEVAFLPDDFPFPPCEGDECYQSIV